MSTLVTDARVQVLGSALQALGALGLAAVGLLGIGVGTGRGQGEGDGEGAPRGGDGSLDGNGRA